MQKVHPALLILSRFFYSYLYRDETPGRFLLQESLEKFHFPVDHFFHARLSESKVPQGGEHKPPLFLPLFACVEDA
jgi:hypothetical protein